MFEFLKKQTAPEDLEREIYRVVAAELEKDEIDRILWVKAFAESEGNRDKAKALYIKYRVEEMSVAAGHVLEGAARNQREEKRLQKERDKELRYRAKMAGAKYIKPRR